MKKFLKGVAVCALVAPCMMGLTACDKEELSPEEAFGNVSANMEQIQAGLAQVETPGGEFQLKINMTYNQESKLNNQLINDESFAFNLRMLLGFRHAEDGNKEILGNVGIKGNDNQYSSLLNAYFVDTVDNGVTDKVYTEVGTILEANWQYYEDIVYIKSGEAYTPATTWAADTVYYIKTTDLLHGYLSSDISLLEGYKELETQPADWATNYTDYYQNVGGVYTKLTAGDSAPEFANGTYYSHFGKNIAELIGLDELGFELENGDMYGYINMGDEEPELTPPATDPVPDDDLLDMGALETLLQMDYEQFKIMYGGEGATVTAEKLSTGEYSIKFVETSEVTTGVTTTETVEVIAKTNGGITFSTISTTVHGSATQVETFIIDIDFEQDFDDTLVLDVEDFDTTDGIDFIAYLEDMFVDLM